MSKRTLRMLGVGAIGIVAMTLPSIVLAQAQPPSLPVAPKRSEIIASGGFLVPGDQVKKMYLGNTVYRAWLVAYRGFARGVVGSTYFYDERHCQYTYQGRLVEGLWWIEGDAWCIEARDSGKPICGLTYETKSYTFSCNRDDGDICRTIQWVVPGNAENYRPK